MKTLTLFCMLTLAMLVSAPAQEECTTPAEIDASIEELRESVPGLMVYRLEGEKLTAFWQRLANRGIHDDMADQAKVVLVVVAPVSPDGVALLLDDDCVVAKRRAPASLLVKMVLGVPS